MKKEERLFNQLAEAQALAKRTLAILEDEEFFECDNEGAWHSSLHRDLTKLAKGRELNDALAIHHKMIKHLEDKLEKFKLCEPSKDNL